MERRFSVLLKPIMRYKCRLVDTFFVHFSLPVFWLDIQCRKQFCFSKRIITVMYMKYWGAVTYRNSIQSATLTQTKFYFLFQVKRNSQGPFCYRRLGKAWVFYLGNLLSFKFSWLEPAHDEADCIRGASGIFERFFVVVVKFFLNLRPT